MNRCFPSVLLNANNEKFQGIAGSVTTFSSWMLEGYEAFSNFNGYSRSGLHDVSQVDRTMDDTDGDLRPLMV